MFKQQSRRSAYKNNVKRQMKLKTHKISIVGYIAGLTWIAMSIQRWWFKYNDPSQLILALLIGFLVLGGAYILNWMRNKDIEISKINKRLDSIVAWWTNQEKDEVRKEARGEDDA